MSKTVHVELGARSYDIRIAPGTMRDVGAACRELGLGTACLLVTDDRVEANWGDACRASLQDAGFSVGTKVLPHGEVSKTGAHLFSIYDAALEQGLDRRGFIVALGGGVVGDVAGYAAASFLRGIPFVQVPTSLVAMVDSAVGGKTGINLPQGKNLIGAFHQPAAVLVDTDTAHTLPEREYVSGLGEVIKYGVIHDAELFDYLEARGAALRKPEPDVLAHIVARSCEIKAEVVAADEREGGLRAILNFGHTLGHAVEKVAGYGQFLHGEAIGVGMVYAGRLSVKERGFPEASCRRLEALTRAAGLPVRAPECSWPELRAAMSVDKKSRGGSPRFVLAKELGTVEFGCVVSEETLEEVWNEMASG